MKRILLSNVIDITKDKLHYRDDNGNVVDIELALCANNYESTHNIINKNELKVRCVGERFFGEYAYYELFTEEHTQIYMNLKTNAFKRFITKITGWNFHSRDFQQFYALQKKFNANGWTTLDLS